MINKPELDVAKLRKNIGNGVHRLRFGGISVPVCYRRGSNDIMVVIFHGAVDRKKRTIPRFQPLLPNLGDCHQLSIADPTLEIDPAIAAGWYIGGESMPLQADLPGLLKTFSTLSGVKKRLYLGGSSGGFAALYYSWSDPGSICIAVNPQVNLASYKLGKSAPTEYFAKKAWPCAGSFEAVSEQAVIDLSTIYAQRFDNMVIYLQSIGDLRHYGVQLPNICNIGLKSSKHFILNSGYWGIPHHGNSVPSKTYYPWVQAVVTAPWFDRQGILDTHHALTAKSASATDQTSPDNNKSVAMEDIRFADLLSHYHLRQTQGD